ncbi:type II toxin-antitoxin system HipA family toxin YjjJ [Cupriavidus sp. CV2]|uniref:type II toxin-antitoxin system HipA family toxin YjjJ n=1 Tax=Cupriavidus ulmosensis TaxID=3065913 RepID=UPI00296B1BED|nr:type II toxin-antitoxin system HipA family toxin YjjJ [Cupriavidus sp. CV2]MDW3683642.1 type II toxin-antitoxin system HipA family toxin YjjJ [Cupriavidus sp. CV2]
MIAHTPALLDALSQGPANAGYLCGRLGISQPTLSRRIAEAGDRVLRIGNARAVRYLARRSVAGQAQLALYRVTVAGRIEQWGELLPVHPGFVVRQPGQNDRWFEGLPWWLLDMRPQGFLGRHWVRQRAAGLGLPDDLLTWSDDHVLAALAAGQHDVTGNLLLGDLSRDAWLAHQPDNIAAGERAQRFPGLAAQSMAGERVGSSAGGEQPKLAIQVDGQDVLVKFSAAQDSAISQRWRDLLLAEHLALQQLVDHGLPAAKSELLDASGQRFLQVARFDRTAQGGRRGVVSLAVLDAEFVGRGRGAWPAITDALLKQDVITDQAHHDAGRLYAFGRLIGNTDMHFGNLAFLHDGALPLSLTPAYDMLPMGLAPDRSGAMRDNLDALTPPAQPPADIWQEMLPSARTYWRRLAEHPLASAEFAAISGQQQAWLDDVDRQLERLA